MCVSHVIRSICWVNLAVLAQPQTEQHARSVNLYVCSQAQRFGHPQSDQRRRAGERSPPSPRSNPPTRVCTIRRADGFTTQIRRVGFGGLKGEKKGKRKSKRTTDDMWICGTVKLRPLRAQMWLDRAIDAGRSDIYSYLL